MADRIKINRIQHVLFDREIAQKDLAKKIGVTANTISKWCRNDSQPSLKVLREIAIFLGCEMGDLLQPLKKKG